MHTSNKPQKIALIGSYPPPYGGVTIHIQRLMKKLDEFNIQFVLYDVLGVNRESQTNRIICIKHPKLWIVKYFFLSTDEIIHCHIKDWRVQFIIGLMGILGKKTIITLHSEELIKSWREFNYIKRKCIQISLKSTTHLIVVNSNIMEFCLSIGVNPNKILLIPAFIPPTLEKEDANEMPNKIWDFFKTHHPILTANAFKINITNNVDVYGIDLCIELCFKLKQNWNQIGFIFVLPKIGDEEYFALLKQRIIELNLQNNFLFVTKPYQLYPILTKSDMFIRPTNTDGDSLSIREALFFGVPVIATDVVQRPEGVILFKNRDLKSLTDTTVEVLKNYDTYRSRIATHQSENSAEKIIGIYQKLINDENYIA